MNDNDQRNIEDFYDHRAEVLKRIQAALKEQKKKAK